MATLDAWLNQLENTPHFLSTPAPERIKIMLKRFAFKKDFFVITIAGTNGKGTTTHLLSNYLTHQGLKTGRFTSPHLLKFNERIAIDNQDASDAEIIAAFELIASKQQELTLTYFDYSFLAALLIFQKHKINVACLEVGLGGRLDATNALDTDFAIITTINLDHQQQLGETREAIGFEKAQIMRENTPCVCGDLETPESIKAYAKKINARFYLRHQDFEIIKEQDSWQLKTTATLLGPCAYPVHLPLQNAATALMSLWLLAPILNCKFDLKLFNQLLATQKVPGRMQILSKQPLIMIDVAHNPESANYLATQVQKTAGKTYALFSALNDKDLIGIIKPLSTIINTWYIFELNTPRATNIQSLEQSIKQINNQAQVKIISDLENFCTTLKNKLNHDDRLIVFGSFMLASEFLKFYRPAT